MGIIRRVQPFAAQLVRHDPFCGWRHPKPGSQPPVGQLSQRQRHRYRLTHGQRHAGVQEMLIPEVFWLNGFHIVWHHYRAPRRAAFDAAAWAAAQRRGGHGLQPASGPPSHLQASEKACAGTVLVAASTPPAANNPNVPDQRDAEGALCRSPTGRANTVSPWRASAVDWSAPCVGSGLAGECFVTLSN
jgi:hypothetical protein